jgi:rubrerythrin
MKYTCPCCGYKTLDEEPPGTYDICKIVFGKMMIR